jgi:DNA/RNA-binding domain of Phe-tRNA-synthetase-like protein
MIDLNIDSRLTELAVGLTQAKDVRIGESGDALRGYCDEVARRVSESGLLGGDDRRGAVRQLLRGGGFKPAGRSKPAQEYLLRTINQDGSLPNICNVVDFVNAVSLDCALPISLVSIERAGPGLTIRYGEAGERYVFNRAGQELDAAGLICLCSQSTEPSTPLGSPVKDSMAGKVTDQNRHVLACIYAPQGAVEPDELRRWSEQLGDGFVKWCGATATECRVLPETWAT